MRVLIVLLSLFAISLMGLSQPISFMNVYGNSGYDYGRDIKQGIDSGFVITGSSSSFATENSDAYLLKINKYGDFLWSMNFGGADSDWGQSIVITYDSSYAIAGYTNSFGNGGFDFYLIRTDSSGNLLWEKTYGGSDWDQAFDLVQTSDSGFVLVGYSYAGLGEKDAYIVKTDKNGDTLWTKIIGGSGEDFLNGVYLDGDSIVVCGGSSSNGNGMLDGFICKMDLNGNIGWQKYIGSPSDDYFTSISHYNNYYALGGIRGYNYDVALDDMWFYKISDDGTVELTDTTYQNLSVENDGIYDVALNPINQNIFFAGYSASYGFLADGLTDMFLGKMTSTDIFVTSTTYGEAGDDVLFALDLCTDLGVVFVGDTKYYSTGGNNIVIIKLNPLWEYPNQFVDLTYHNITNSINEPVQNIRTSVFPNPAENVINIEVYGEFDSIEIYTTDGKLMFQTDNGEQEINVENFPSGVYIVSITADGKIYTQKLIKS